MPTVRLSATFNLNCSAERSGRIHNHAGSISDWSARPAVEQFRHVQLIWGSRTSPCVTLPATVSQPTRTWPACSAASRCARRGSDAGVWREKQVKNWVLRSPGRGKAVIFIVVFPEFVLRWVASKGLSVLCCDVVRSTSSVQDISAPITGV